jgi:hypothetical protein
MKPVLDRLRMVFFGIFVIVVGVFSPKTCMRAIGEVVCDSEDYNPIRIRERHRKEFLASYTSQTQRVDQ